MSQSELEDSDWWMLGSLDRCFPYMLPDLGLDLSHGPGHEGSLYFVGLGIKINLRRGHCLKKDYQIMNIRYRALEMTVQVKSPDVLNPLAFISHLPLHCTHPFPSLSCYAPRLFLM